MMKTTPIEIIRKAELEIWVEDDRFAGVFPTWVVSLINAEAGDLLQECSFPTKDEAFAHGYDGTLITKGSALNIPEGRSSWELGKDKTVRNKAKKEYKRVLENLGVDAKNHTFVFVTPRTFKQKKGKNAEGRFNEKTREDWVNARISEGEFKDVKVIDERMLREWSDKHLDVGLQIKKTFSPNFTDQNIELPEDTVSRYVAGFSNDKIDETILFCGREELVAKVRKFKSEGSPFELFAGSEDEALAFAAAALCMDETKEAIWSPTLVIKSASALKNFQGYSGKTFVVTSDAASDAFAVQNDNNIIVCCSLDAKNIDHPNVLRDPQHEVLEKALQDREVDDAGKLAGMAGGSISCLRRVLGGGTTNPSYMAVEGNALESVIFATLLGGWNENDKVTFDKSFESLDKRIIADNLPDGISISQFKSALNTHIDKGEERTAADVLLKRIDKSYLIKAPVDAIDNVLGLMEPDHFECFEKILLQVFSGDKEVSRDPDVPFDSGHTYSAELQTGLALNFCILAYRGVERRKRFCGQPAGSWIAGVFKKLNNEVDFIEFIKEKAGLLGYFAEAAPDAFMDALEGTLQGNEDGIRWLLTIGEDEFNFMGENRATGLMWGLQRLAWNPDNFERVVQLIVKLNHLDPDPNANMHPRPSSVFRQFFVTFAPQTSVTWEERIRIISELPHNRNESLFPLITASLPKSRSSVSLDSKPVFGRFGQPTITHKDYYDVNEAMFECALARTDGEASRIVALIDYLSEMNDDVFKKAISQFRKDIFPMGREEKKLLWERLRGLIVRHSRFPDADWSMPEGRISVLTEWRDELEPSKDDWAKYLFSEAYIQDFDAEDSLTDNKLEAERVRVVTELLDTQELDAFLEFSVSVNEHGYLGLATAKASKSFKKQVSLVRKAVARSDVSEFFLRGCSQSSFGEFGEEWLDWLVSEEAVVGFPDLTVKMLACLRIDEAISKRIESPTLPESFSTAYWSSVHINFWPRNEVSLEDIEQLLKHKRQAEVLSALSLYLEKQNDKVLKALTIGIYESVNALPEDRVHQGIVRDILHLLKLCKERELFPVEEIAKYEVPIAKHVRWSDQKYPLAIHELATSKAETFIELLALAYKTSKPHPVQNKTQSDEEKKRQWELSYHILDTIRHPKLDEGKTPEPLELENWVSEVRESSKEYGLEEIADYKIGEVLALSSHDPNDGIWPRTEVRDIIEAMSSSRMLNGIQTKQFNERGTYSDGYNFYNKLADRFEDDAAKLKNWPKTQKFLRKIAKSDRRHADEDKKREDQYQAMPKL